MMVTMIRPKGVNAIMPIMGIILPIILALPSKIPIDVDISGPRPMRVDLIRSEAYPGGTHYSVQKNSMSRYIIGRVRDGQDVLMDGDPMAVSRYILVQNRQDGMRYIRVTTRWRITGSFRNHVDEFIKRVGDAHYAPIIRVPIEVDIPTQDVGPYINVELLGDWEEHDRRPGVMPADIESMPILFTIQPEMRDGVVIGMVKYGHHILNDDVEGLMERTVIWEGGVEKPIITITSRYNDGTEVATKHKFYRKYNGFRALGSTKRLVGLLE